MQGLKNFGGLLAALMAGIKPGSWRAARPGKDGQLKDMVRYVTVGQQHRNSQRAKRREQIRLLGIRQFKKLQRQQRRA